MIVANSAPTFALLRTKAVKPWSLVSSVGVHTALAGIAILVGPYLGPDPGAIRQMRLRVEIHIPPAAFLSAPAAAPARKPLEPQPGGALPARTGLPAPKLVLPELPRSNAKELTILLPNLPKPPSTQLEEIRVPSMMVWTPARVQPKVFVMPGARESRPSDLQSAAPLSLELPKDLPAVADLSIRSAPVPDAAKLTVQLSASRPVRAFQPPPTRAAAPAAPIETIVGDPTSIVVLSPSAQQSVDRIRLPEGSQIAAIHASRPTDAAPPDPAGKGGAVAIATVDQHAATAQAAIGPKTPGDPASLPGGIKIVGGSGSAPSAAASGTTGGIPGPPLLSASVAIRVEHPVNGVFDVVVVQSSALNDFPGIASLSGSPVYTVYLPVGRSRMWVMQYCIPKEQVISKREGIVVQLGNPAPLKPPYPRVTVAPPGAFEKIVVHGFISDTGQFEGLRTLSGEKAATETMLLPLLERWMMRPATRDGKPVRVEMMLMIAGS